MEKLQNASLVLETYYLPTTENNIGVKNSANTNFTWNNLNLRTMLGDMWDKYDYFNLVLVEISTTITPATSSPTGAELLQNLYISGLPFTNSTYDTQLKLNTNKVIFTTFTFGGANVAINKLYNGVNILTFRKEQEQCNLNIFYNQLGTSTATAKNYPNITIIFDIIGVRLDDEINIKSRMIK